MNRISNINHEIPSLSKTKNMVVILHGYGADGEDMMSLVPFLQEALPHTHFYCPDGIEKCTDFGLKRRWFDLFLEEDDMVTSVAIAANKTTELINKKINAFGLDEQNVILAGFSQGAMLAIYIALISGNKYAGVIGFSGKLIYPKKIINTCTPICLIHGVYDEVVLFDEMDKAYNALKLLNIDVRKFAMSNLAHTIDLRGIEIAKKFIQEVTEDARIK